LITSDGRFHENGKHWPGQAVSLVKKEVLDHHLSEFQDALGFESTHHGNVLILDGVIQVTERDEIANQEMISHIPYLPIPNPKKVPVLGVETVECYAKSLDTNLSRKLSFLN